MQGTLDNLVGALCADFKRRDELIRCGGLSRRIETELRYLNCKIIDAANQIVSSEEIFIYINEIGRGIGYAKSEIESISEVTYKNKKRKIKETIAKNLHLM